MNALQESVSAHFINRGASVRSAAVFLAALGLCQGCASADEVYLTPEPAKSGPLDPTAPSGPGDALLAFDVSADMSRFAFAKEPVCDDGFPAYGNPFVTSGYLYPSGFLDEHPGTDALGQPASPEQVLGEWTCRGWMIGDGVRTSSGPIVATTQIYDLYQEPGYSAGKQSTSRTLLTDGYELVDVGQTGLRAVTGGTGPYRGARGQMEQVLLGLNESEGVNLRVAFDIE